MKIIKIFFTINFKNSNLFSGFATKFTISVAKVLLVAKVSLIAECKKIILTKKSKNSI